MTPTEQLEAARKTLGELHEKLSGIDARKAEIDAERDKISFAAHASGNKKAVDRLAEIEAEEGDLDRRAKGIAAAIRTAQREVEAGHAAVEAEERADRARQSLALADTLEASGKDAGKALTAFVAAMGRIKATTAALRGNEALMSPADLVDINLKRAIKSELIGAGLADATVPVSERETIAAMIGSYAETARRAAERQLQTAAGADVEMETGKEAA